MEMFQKMIMYTKSIIEMYVNDESGKDSKEKYESLNNDDFMNIYLQALKMSNMNSQDEDLKTNIVICFDYYV
ncbi:MAG: hypothetical protein J6S85_04690 [Methanobrevibacter sp.]|nr:hypothetical protein [Methanobrevibacter sp.]